MQLPPEIAQEIDDLAAQVPFRELRDAAERLTAMYSAGERQPRFDSRAARIAYLAVRFPATYAACAAALGYVREILPSTSLRTMLDLGSGPGTAIAAAARAFALTHITAIEADANIAVIPDAAVAPRVAIKREVKDIVSADFAPAELVTMSYSLGEIQPNQRAHVIEKAWRAASEILLVIEPGTPAGYERILRVREQLLSAGGHIVAPCPHEERCPMVGTKDWCHFAARVERSSLHRRLKGGALGHEDEKFSYVAFTRNEVPKPEGRIVRHPQHGSGRVRLELCVDGKELRDRLITRSDKKLYRSARNAAWGDAWPPILESDEH